MGIFKISIMQFLGFMALFGLLAAGGPAFAKNLSYDFIIQEASYTRLCQTKKILTVNGKFPGPTIYALKGDTLVVWVHNMGKMNVTLHWHGVAQPRNPWSDGPEYITQCPIKPGASFTQTILLSSEEGTLWWHAHSDWTRATVHGAIVIRPRNGTYPFATPHKEYPIILGEWWKTDVGKVLEGGLQYHLGFNISDAHTINGQPGDFYDCSKPGTFTAWVEHGKSYLLRVINAAMQDELFFAVAGHSLTVVGTDGHYTKSFTTDYIVITPGQTMDVLLVANQTPGRYYMAASPYTSAPIGAFNSKTTTAILRYVNATVTTAAPLFPSLPSVADDYAATSFAAGLRAPAPVDVPKTDDDLRRLLVTVSVNLQTSAPRGNAKPFEGFTTSLNNISFQLTKISVLEAYYWNISGVYGTNFPSEPPFFFNFTGDDLPRNLSFARPGTEVRELEYNTSVEVVFQVTNLMGGADSHPLHLHGYSFYTVGSGFGNWDVKDVFDYNVVDPPRQNTVNVPKNGWVAIRFRATNPGVWFMHCHLEGHSVWGMDTVFIVKNGATSDQSMLPRPQNMPPCSLEDVGFLSSGGIIE